MPPARLTAYLIASAILLTSIVAQAQYFGKNKVRYHGHQFEVLKTQHFDIFYYVEEKKAAGQAARMAERWYERLSEIFRIQLHGRQPLVLYGSHPAFARTTITPELIGPGTGGFTEPVRRRVVMPMGGSLGQTDHVLGHELVHAFQFSIMSQGGAGMRNRAGPGLPLWFIEGMAEYLSIGPVDPNTTMWMRDAVARNDVPSIADLSDPKYFPYRWGQAFLAYVGGKYGDRAVGAMMVAGAAGGVAGAIERVLHTDPKRLSTEWQEALKASARPILHVTTPPSEAGRVLVREKEPGGFNVSPALSPDGKYFMYFAEGKFAINLYLADAHTGKVLKNVTRTAFSKHLSNLEFISASGSWTRDSNEFAYGHVTGPNAVISIFNVNQMKVTRDLPLKGLGEVFSTTWSPDGKQIAFSAVEGGITNLYVVDVHTGKVRQVTNDEFAELQPAWSPDGKSIALVTDRFTSDLNDLSFGHFRLGRLDLASGDIQPIQTFDSGRSTDPHWAADGSSIFFVSTREGIPDIYRLDLRDDSLNQVTNLQTGVSGITSLSPAFSVATADPALLFSVFHNSGYEILRLSEESDLAGRPVENRLAGMSAAVLPPRSQPGGEVVRLLDSPKEGLVGRQGFQTKPYSASLSLDYIAPPAVGAGVTSFGTVVAGGTALHFSDMLNFHDLTVAFQTGVSTETGNILRNTVLQATYVNRRTRWNWGVYGAQVPYATSAYSSRIANVSGENAVVDQRVTEWQIERQAGGLLQYPLNLAQRLEFDAGYDNISFAAEARTRAISVSTGDLVVDDTQQLDTPGSLNLATADAAFVEDTSIFGGVSPVAGTRYRFQIGATTGSLTYYPALVDFRKYFYLGGPFSVAAQVLHFGRYGSGSENSILQDFYIGYPSLVRGYDLGSISLSECGPQFQQTGRCPAVERLLGSRILVGKAEFRTEILGPLGAVPHSQHTLPVEAALFYDAGAAWTSSQEASFLGGHRGGVSSEGVALRFNLFGIFIGQISAAHPNDRPQRNWVWQFSFLPGF